MVKIMHDIIQVTIAKVVYQQITHSYLMVKLQM